MIKIEFFDANGRFVVRHIVEMVPMRKYPSLWIKTYCKAIFYWYKDAGFASVTVNGLTQIFDRYE